VATPPNCHISIILIHAASPCPCLRAFTSSSLFYGAGDASEHGSGTGIGSPLAMYDETTTAAGAVERGGLITPIYPGYPAPHNHTSSSGAGIRPSLSPGLAKPEYRHVIPRPPLRNSSIIGTHQQPLFISKGQYRQRRHPQVRSRSEFESSLVGA
jgi:hypothetical protein